MAGRVRGAGSEDEAVGVLPPECFLSVEADEETASQYIERFGDDNLVFSTDYPHADSKFPKSVESFRGLPLPEASKKKILWDNWVKLYGVNGR